MDRIDLYRIFIRVIEARSFTKAADALQMPRSSVSAAIAELEARLGARLFHRTTRTVTPTDEGEKLLERCLAFLAESDEIEMMFRSGERRVEGRIWADVLGRIGHLILGSRHIDPQSQNKTVAASATADRNVFAHLS